MACFLRKISLLLDKSLSLFSIIVSYKTQRGCFARNFFGFRNGFIFTVGGVQAYNFGNFNFEIGVEGKGQKHVPTFSGWGLGAKMGLNTKIVSKIDRALILTSFESSRKKIKIKKVKIRRKMIELCQLMFRLKSGIWPILGLKLAILATFFKISTSNLFRLIEKPN